MALQLDKDLGNGITANYFKIAALELNIEGNSVRIKMAVYKDAAARAAGNAPMMGFDIGLDDTEFPLSIAAQDVAGKNVSKLCYEKIKTYSQVRFPDQSWIDLTTASDV